MIYGPTSLGEDRAAVEANSEKWQYLVTQLAKKSLEEGITPEQFDQWFTRVREDGYVQLVKGGRQLSEVARKAAKELAAQMMRALMWWAYRLMGHCYGVLMFLIAMDLMESTGRRRWMRGSFAWNTARWIFWQGCRWISLAGSNFAGSLRVWQGTLTEIAHPDFLERQERGDFSFDAYLQFPSLLGVFAALVRERREADTRTKDQTSGETEDSTPRPGRQRTRTRTNIFVPRPRS